MKAGGPHKVTEGQSKVGSLVSWPPPHSTGCHSECIFGLMLAQVLCLDTANNVVSDHLAKLCHILSAAEQVLSV